MEDITQPYKKPKSYIDIKILAELELVLAELPQQYMPQTPLANFLEELLLVKTSGYFDSSWYLQNSRSVANLSIDPVLHYLLYGVEKGLNPSPDFDTKFYLQQYTDVATSGVNPLVHYLHHGISEGRHPKSLAKRYVLWTYLKDITNRPKMYFRKIPRLLTYFQQHGLKGLGQLLATKALQEHSRNNLIEIKYEKWLEQFDTLTTKDREDINKHIKTFANKPLVSIILPTYNTPEKLLRRAIESVLRQLYPYWELCIVDDASTKAHVKKVLQEYQQDQRIKVTFRAKNGHISAASNNALETATGKWLVLLDHDDELSEHALYLLVNEINNYPEAMFIYSDEDKIAENNQRYEPYFKPDWNPDLFLSYNYVTHLAAYLTERVKDLGGFREGFEGSQDYDLALRFTEDLAAKNIRHISQILYHWRSTSGSTAATLNAKNYAAKAGLKAVTEHLKRLKVKAETTLIPHRGTMLRVRYDLPNPEPLVSIIIPTKDEVELLAICLKSIWTQTSYTNYEIIIVDNNSSKQKTLDYFAELASDNKARVMHYHKPFNYSAINNFAARAANGSVLCFLNNDIEVITKEWLTEMTSQAIRTEIAAVGAKLLYPDDTIQHGGVILGVGGVAGHAHKYMSTNDVGYFCRADLIQNFSAVTAACLVVEKKLYEEVAGFDEKNLTIAFNDVDFCLRLQKAGYRNLWTPYALLYHHESKTRGYEDTPEKRSRFKEEIEYMQSTWQGKLYNDPAYNLNLSLESENFALGKSRVKKPWQA